MEFKGLYKEIKKNEASEWYLKINAVDKQVFAFVAVDKNSIYIATLFYFNIFMGTIERNTNTPERLGLKLNDVGQIKTA